MSQACDPPILLLWHSHSHACFQGLAPRTIRENGRSTPPGCARATATRWHWTVSNLTVNDGEVYGYLGPNGAGKTTTIRLLLGLHRPSAGHAELFGLDAWSEPVNAHKRVAYVAGEPSCGPR